MRQTSLKAWERIKDKLSPRRKAVFLHISRKPGITLREVAKKMKVGVNQISGRFTELEKLRLIKEVGQKKFKGERQPHTMWRATK